MASEVKVARPEVVLRKRVATAFGEPTERERVARPVWMMCSAGQRITAITRLNEDRMSASSASKYRSIEYS